MRNVIFYVLALLCLFVSKAFAQQTFEDRIKIISDKISVITKEEKEALKLEVDAVNKQVQEGQLTIDQADQKKLEYAETRAANIERRTAAAQEELKKLVQEKVDGKITEKDSTRRYRISIGSNGIKVEEKSKDTIRGEQRTTSQLVFAFGLNHYMKDGAIAHSDYRVWGSHFYELGLTLNTRILPNNNLLHVKYGLSMQWNTVRPTDNRYFAEQGDQTNLVNSSINLGDSRFRTVNLVVPVHLEFDFSGKETDGDKTYFRTHQGWRVGIGGFVGGNVKAKRILEYENEENNEVKNKTVGDFNVNDFVYGLSAYVGYESISLYCKYDLNPVFEDNATDERNISFGVRFDFN